MLNTITIHGRLTRDPELRYTANQTAVASFTVAVDRDYPRDKVDFLDCIAWRGTGEFISKYFTKGSEIIVSGRLEIRDWEDKNGNKRRNAEINVSSVDFCGSKRQQGEPQEMAPQEFVEMDEDGELPF